MNPLTNADWNLIEHRATATDIALGYATELGQIIWLEADTGAVIG